MNEVNISALFVRAFKTFLQAFASIVAVNIASVHNIATGKALILSAVAAGISAVMNLFIRPTEAK